jgi:SAM-dependent methyltransferase
MPQQMDQRRWNEHGAQQLRRVRQRPDRHVVRRPPLSDRPAQSQLMKEIGPLASRRILEIGSGTGRNAVYLAARGAEVTGVDIGPDLVAASAALADANRVGCLFACASATHLPFESGTFDVVMGLAILHHLSKAEVRAALAEAHRVLAPDGTAVFYEPVENSRAFDFLQSLIPAGRRDDPHYRPSILDRKAWAAYIATMDDRAMTNVELVQAGMGRFRDIELHPYGLTIRLQRLLPPASRTKLHQLDQFLLSACPPLNHFCQTVLAVYRK